MDKNFKIFGSIFFILIILGVGTFFLVHHFREDEPILVFIPRPNKYKNADSSLIWINRYDEQNNSPWGTQLVNFIKEYADSSIWEGNAMLCSFANGVTANDSTYCIVEVDHIEHTMSSPEISFGYAGSIGKPSVLLMLKNRHGWVPEAYNLDDLEEAQNLGMPVYLRDQIMYYGSDNATMRMLNTTWISCEGSKPADRENIGRITYYTPGMGSEIFFGIPNYYFPYMKQSGYQTPFVIVQFPEIREHILVGVECRAWAKNIGTDDEKGPVKTEFELLID